MVVGLAWLGRREELCTLGLGGPAAEGVVLGCALLVACVGLQGVK